MMLCVIVKPSEVWLFIYSSLLGDGFEHLRASVTLLTGAVCIDLPPFESCHVRLSDARERETEKWKSRGNKTAFCLDKRLFYPPNGLIKCLFSLIEFSEGMSI